MRQAMPKSKSFLFITAVVAIQGVHVVEHIIQLIQVYLLGVPEDDALGLLGYVFEFQGTEEWLHLVFNVTYLAGLYVLVPVLSRATREYGVPQWAFLTFLFGAVGLETWHVAEHAVIISHVIANQGCPCPGIADAATGLTDTVLHFGYNAATYIGLVVPFWFVIQARHGARRMTAKMA
jgi:hypothetical protein